jgi:hypothetical protein
MANIEILEQKLGGSLLHPAAYADLSNTTKGEGLQFVSILMSD